MSLPRKAYIYFANSKYTNKNIIYSQTRQLRLCSKYGMSTNYRIKDNKPTLFK